MGKIKGWHKIGYAATAAWEHDTKKNRRIIVDDVTPAGDEMPVYMVFKEIYTPERGTNVQEIGLYGTKKDALEAAAKYMRRHPNG